MEPDQKPSKADGNEAYKRWYAKHRKELSERRKLRYQNDPEYRAKALAQKKKQMERLREQHKVPEGYTLSLQSIAESLGVTIWTLREWRKKDYFPEPLKAGRNLLFTENQLGLLSHIEAFIKGAGKRLSRDQREKLVDVVNFVHANWS